MEEFQEIKINTQKFAIDRIISNEILEGGIHCDMTIVKYAKHTALKFRADINSFPSILTLRGSITTTKPASWWQHFKQTFFPSSWLDLFPVKLISTKHFLEREYHVSVLLPNLDVHPQLQGACYYYTGSQPIGLDDIPHIELEAD
jgi:hypothetical protein